MKKSLIALAVVGAFTAQAAMADTTIYGAANVSFDAVNNGAVASSANANNVASNVSKLGFKGSEDLGDGLTAVYQFENAITMDTGGFGGARDTFVGLSSATAGTVLAGVHDTPYKIATRGLDLFSDTIADNRSIMGGAGLHDLRVGNALAYVSPAMSGVTVAIATSAGAEVPTANATKASVWSLAALYGAGPINVNFGYQTATIGSGTSGTFGATTFGNVPANLIGGAVVATATNDKATAWKIGGSYTMDALQVNAIYEKLGYTRAGTDLLNESNFYLAGKYNVSASDAVKLAYTSAGKSGTPQNPNTDATQFTVGYDHGLSKRTTVYALYSKLSNKSAADYTFSQSTSAANANGGVGSAPSVFSLGVKHAF